MKLSQVVGQRNTVDKLMILMSVCKQERKPMPHILLEGSPGLGKTTLARAIAAEVGGDLLNVNAATVKSLKDMLPILSKITPGSILFIDEVHRLPVKIQESLYTVMEDYKLDLATKAEPIAMSFPLFTLIGATTKMGLLQKPFIDRFQLHEVLVDYSDEELSEILFNLLLQSKTQATAEAIDRVVQRSKATPRIAKKLLAWVIYWAKSKGISTVNETQVGEALDFYGLDKDGLSLYDRKYLAVLAKYKGQPVGLNTLADELNLSEETIKDYFEPFLIKMGKVLRTKKGRVLAS